MEAPPLTPTEERILTLIREGRFDAEIAVQLGLPVGDLKERVDRLTRKLGAASRSDLRDSAGFRAPSSPALPVHPDFVTVELRPPATAPPAVAPRRARPAFAVVAATILAAAAAAGIVVGLSLRNSQERRPLPGAATVAAEGAPNAAVKTATRVVVFVPGSPGLPALADIRGELRPAYALLALGGDPSAFQASGALAGRPASMALGEPIEAPSDVVIFGLRRSRQGSEVVRWSAREGSAGTKVLLGGLFGEIFELEASISGATLAAITCAANCDATGPSATMLQLSTDGGIMWTTVVERSQRIFLYAAASGRALVQLPEAAPGELVWLPGGEAGEKPAARHALGGPESAAVSPTGLEIVEGGPKSGDLERVTRAFVFDQGWSLATSASPYTGWRFRGKPAIWATAIRIPESRLPYGPLFTILIDTAAGRAAPVLLPPGVTGDGLILRAVLQGGWRPVRDAGGRGCVPIRETASDTSPSRDCVIDGSLVRPSSGGGTLGATGAWIAVEAHASGAEGWIRADALDP